MDGIEAHRRFERLLADVLASRDPSAPLEKAKADPELPAALKEAIAGADPEGVALTALLVAKLRFERLIRGSSRVGEWFDRDPRGFTEAFRRYHADVAPTTSEPRKEARFFEGWLAARGVDPGGS
ncbi:MAG TPA: hypothetical protein VFI25_18800 [Planctomycetota bacterium]|jgi:hypothetical protein|nr:hypothetical protein [Planctomycetota bacterium]